MSVPATLSVVIISHNQKEVLKRCLDSILAQKTTFPVEVIVSDDRSADGTREMLLSDYKEKVTSVFFDSDTVDTTFTLERAAYNRINGLKYATGKYLIHTDGDDFFTSTDIFQLMVDKLEAHPECNLCCQNYCIVPEDNINFPHSPFNKSKHFELESILTAEEFITEVGPVVNACICARRTNQVRVTELDGKLYDDNDITMRYLGNSSVILVNRCDFVYVQYKKSSCSSITDAEKLFLFNGIPQIQLAPDLAVVMLKMNIGAIRNISKYVVLKKPIPERIVRYFGSFNIFLLSCLSNNMSFSNRWKYFRIYILSILLLYLRINAKSFLYRRLYRLAV